MPVISDEIDQSISEIQVFIRACLRDDASYNEEDLGKLSQSQREKLNQILEKTYEITEILMK